MLLTCLDADCRVPTRCHSWGSGTCFGDWLCHDLVLALIPTSNISAHLQVEIMATNMQSTVKRAIRVLGKYYIDPIGSSVDLLHLLSEFTGIVDDKKVSRPLIVKYSQNMNVPLQTLEHKFDNRKRTEQKLKLGQSGWRDKLLVCMQSYTLMRCSIFEEGNDLNIEIYKKHSLRLKIRTFGHASQDELLCKANIQFDNLWKHLSESQKEAKCELVFALIASNILRVPQQTSR